MKTKNRIWFSPLVIIIMGLLCLAGWCTKEPDTNPSGSITDKDGNVYTSVTIGSQVWMVENLKTTKYNDGTAIPNVTDNTAWAHLTTGAYCWYNNDISNKTSYGALYNWYTVNTGKLCPTGWHVPSGAEWTTLVDYLGGWEINGGKLKEAGTTHWQSPNLGATNETGFTGLPGSDRSYNDGLFTDMGRFGFWWSITPYIDIWGENRAGYFTLYKDETWGDIGTESFGSPIGNGYSVRCLKD